MGTQTIYGQREEEIRSIVLISQCGLTLYTIIYIYPTLLYYLHNYIDIVIIFYEIRLRGGKMDLGSFKNNNNTYFR